MRRDRRSQLSNLMRARLRPQTPGVEKPCIATAQKANPGPSVAPVIPDWPPHSLLQWVGGDMVSRGPPDSISRQLDDMLSTLFSSHIIKYEPPRGFIMPKFVEYDRSNDPFDHIMHYRQLVTLNIGNDVLLYKVFLARLQGQALLWFHHLPMNYVDNF